MELLDGDERSLRRILDALDSIEGDNAERAAGVDVIELAAKRNAKRRGNQP